MLQLGALYKLNVAHSIPRCVRTTVWGCPVSFQELNQAGLSAAQPFTGIHLFLQINTVKPSVPEACL